MNEFEQLGLQ